MPKKVQFQIVHCSGADEGHSAKELEFHGPTTKGWQSSRFCLYPQEVVLMLKDTQRIRKLQVLAHQYLIPTKIEIFVGRVPIGQPASLLTCKYKRLGYVGLSSNEKTEFKARELKSIHLDAEGQFVKLLIHKNHVNRYNLYNQVNLVAVNVIADPHDNMYDDPLDPDPLRNVDNIVQRYMKPDPFASMTGDPIWGKINRPDFVSPVDDLAFDMYQDPETAELIRKLEAKKKDAVQNERYEYAKKLKAVVADLYKVGEKLGKYEVEKKQAVEQEDYDLAQERKKQSDEFRLYVYKQLNISELLELDGKQYKEHANLHITSPLPPIPSEKTPSPNPPQQQVLRSSPPLKPLNAKSRFSPEPRKPEQVSPRMPVIQDEPLDERPLPALNKSQPDEDNDEDTENSPNSSDGPEPLKDNDARVASSAIGVFGEHLVQCSFSKQWKFRQEAMDELNKELTSSSPELSHDQDPRSVSRATMFLVKKGIKEKVHSVFMSCLIVLRSLLLTYIPKHKLGKGETHQVLEKVVPELLLKAGETTHRSREAAIDMIIEMAKYDDALLLGIIPDIVTQPFKPKPPPPWRLLKSKLEIIEKLLEVLELDKHKSGSLHSSAIMQFAVTALDHSNGDIRDAAVNLIFIMYKKIGEPIKSYLPDDGPATRKSPLYRSIFDGFDRIDGKPTESERRAQAKQDRKQVEKTKQAEIEALQAQLQALRDMAQGGGGGGGNADIKGTKPTKKKQEEPPVDVDRMCIFCGEKNASFTEDALDLHYWKNCPMLKRCDHCSQVVEVSGFNEHLLSECDAKDKFSQCPKCKDVMLTVDLEEHITEKKCIAPKGSKDAKQCPLCRIEIGEAEEAWYSHLMENCKPNKQRLQQQQASKAPSRASVRSNRGRGGKATPSTRGAARGRKGNLPR